MKKTIRMNESEHHRIINESVKRVLNEGSYDSNGNFDMQGHQSELEDSLYNGIDRVTKELDRFEDKLSYLNNASMDTTHFNSIIYHIMELTREYYKNLMRYSK